MKKKVIISALFTLIATAAILVLANNESAADFLFERTKERIFKLDKEKIYDATYLNKKLNSLDTLILKNNDTRYSELKEIIQNLYVEVETGSAVVDKYTFETITSNIKSHKIRFEDYLENETKYKCETTIGEYKNKTSRKAHKINQKHPNWTKSECLQVAKNKLWIGMSEQMARESIGLPSKINKHNYSTGTREQWIYRYSGRYLYFTNGTLTSWSE